MAIGSPIMKLKINVHRTAIEKPAMAAFVIETLALPRQLREAVNITVGNNPSGLIREAKQRIARVFIAIDRQGIPSKATLYSPTTLRTAIAAPSNTRSIDSTIGKYPGPMLTESPTGSDHQAVRP